jgi:hypothetical protein
MERDAENCRLLVTQRLRSSRAARPGWAAVSEGLAVAVKPVETGAVPVRTAAHEHIHPVCPCHCAARK